MRIDSLRRSRRGRRVMAPWDVVVSLEVIIGIVVFVVILVSIEKGTGAVGGAEAPSHGPVGAVGAEIAQADGASFQSLELLGRPAGQALPFVEGGHGWRNFSGGLLLSILPRLGPHGGVAQMVRAGVS